MFKVTNVLDSIIIVQNVARFLGFSGIIVNKCYELVSSWKELLFSLLSSGLMVYVIYNLKSNDVRVSINSGSTFFDNGLQWISVLEMTSVLIVKYAFFFQRHRIWGLFQRIHNVDAIVSSFFFLFLNFNLL